MRVVTKVSGAVKVLTSHNPLPLSSVHTIVGFISASVGSKIIRSPTVKKRKFINVNHAIGDETNILSMIGEPFLLKIYSLAGVCLIVADESPALVTNTSSSTSVITVAVTLAMVNRPSFSPLSSDELITMSMPAVKPSSIKLVPPVRVIVSANGILSANARLV